MTTNCNTSSLNTYIPSSESPWDEKKIKHLYRRIGFGATHDMINYALTKSPSDLIDELIDEAINEPNIEDPGWGFWDKPKFEESYEAEFGINISSSQDTKRYLEYEFFNIFRERDLNSSLLYFWSNHFVTSGLDKVTYMFQQFQMRLNYCLKNFKDFVYEVGLDSLMLFYLNGLENVAGNPNENYARELYELFTLGVDNGYTESDISETARALTGYNKNLIDWGPVEFDEETHDNSEKTIFGQTGNWGYDDVIRILFEERSDIIANFICTKFYKYYVSPEINQVIIDELSEIFIENDFEIAPVLSSLFKSQHFFDEQCFGCIIKSPLDLFITIQKEFEMDFSSNPDFSINEHTRSRLLSLSMRMFEPPNVAGWSEDENWINSVTLPERWSQFDQILLSQFYINKEVLNNFIKKRFDLNEDVNVIVKGVVDFFLSQPLINENEYDLALIEFKGNVPEIYFEDGTWNLDYPELHNQVLSLMYHISRIPEFQLK